MRTGRRTRKANHAIPPLNRPNRLFRLRLLPKTPRKLIRLRHPREFGVQLRALDVVFRKSLSTVGSECIFVQRVDVDGIADGMFGAEICKRMAGVRWMGTGGGRAWRRRPCTG